MLRQYILKHKTRRLILFSFLSIPATSLSPLSLYFLYPPPPPLPLPFLLHTTLFFLLACVHSARIARFLFFFLSFFTPSLTEQRRWIKSFPTTAWLVRLLVKTKLALPTGVFLGGSLYVCMCPDAKKKLGEETNISPPFFHFTCFRSFSLTLSLFLFQIFFF
jgi:hypothetical protein